MNKEGVVIKVLIIKGLMINENQSHAILAETRSRVNVYKVRLMGGNTLA